MEKVNARGWTIEQEADIYEKEACAEIAKEKGNGEMSTVNAILQMGRRVIYGLRQELAKRVKVVHGRWLYDSGTERHFCSVCNEYALSATTQEQVADYDWEENLVFHLEPVTKEFWTDYCPNCGAKMDGDGNG